MKKIKIDIVILAAGESRRFGCCNKLFYNINGKPMYRYTVENALKLKNNMPEIGDVIIVSRFDELKIENTIYIQNNNFNKGITESIHLGVNNVSENNALMFMVCDQPYMKYETLKNLVEKYINSDKGIVCISDKNRNIGNPCIFSRKYRYNLLSLTGDRGGKSIVKDNMDDVELCFADEKELRDIDYIFPFIREKGHIISIVGAGGKTSLMYYLAELFALQGHNTLVTTTTHIYKPDKNYAENNADVLSLWQKGKYAVVGKPCENGKLCMPDDLEEYISMADTVLIEADGSKGMPLKVPDIHEPVIIDKSDIVVGVAGSYAIGKRLCDVCFRLDKAMELLGVEKEHIVTKEDVLKILNSDKGTKKDVGNRDYYTFIRAGIL